MKPLPTTLSLLAFSLSLPAYAEGDLSRADPAEIVIEMGSTESGDAMYFKPDHLDLETGKAYVLVLKNVDDQKHEIAAEEFVEKIFTRKLEITDASGELVAEIKGNIREVEVGPHQEVEWFIVPVQTGEDLKMVCEIEGHEEAGMVGSITIH